MSASRHRVGAAAVGLVAIAVLGSGCKGGYASNLNQREFVVEFAPGATPAQHQAVRAACHDLPNARLEPEPRNQLVASRLFDVRYRIDEASDAQINQLVQCVRNRPGVVGFDIPDTIN